MKKLKRDFEHYSKCTDFIRFGKRSEISIDLNTLNFEYTDPSFAKENKICGFSFSMSFYDFDVDSRKPTYKLTRFYFETEEDKAKFILKN